MHPNKRKIAAAKYAQKQDALLLLYHVACAGSTMLLQRARLLVATTLHLQDLQENVRVAVGRTKRGCIAARTLGC